jgi:dihydrofolate reductase
MFCARDRSCAGAPDRASCVLASEEVVEGMPFVTCHMSISLDGFVAGPHQSAENPLGIDGRKLHDWHLDEPKHPVDEAFTQRLLGPRGAYIMGRNMFGPVRGEWGDSDWRGWWGPEPPYHAPVFVLTHHPHDPINMEAGTTFYFVDGFETALAEAAKQAGDRPIDIAGGASAARQALQARCLNELVLDIVPVILGAGERIFDDVPEFHAEAVEAATSPLATHIVYKITYSDSPGTAAIRAT